jgi:hypothetical protein
MIMRLQQQIRGEIQHFPSPMCGTEGRQEQLLGASSTKNKFSGYKMDHYKEMGRGGKAWNL